MSTGTSPPVALIDSLLASDLYDPPVEKCVLIETHISWVILAGPYAYKIKKPLNLGFLDFSTLEKRHFFCREELRLNRRLAPGIYLSVVPITGSAAHPQWAGNGTPIEYAIKMRTFPQEAQLDRVLALGGLQARQIDVLASHIADFHRRTDIAGPDSPYGEPYLIRQPVDENYRQIREHVKDRQALKLLAGLERWSGTTFHSLQPWFAGRKSGGFIRECHGDMHLRNIAWVDEGPLLFDCIEFNPHLRWIDVMSDIAFLVMDLQDRAQPQLARRFLNNYMEHTGDYAGVRGLRYYQVYRALVRAKIDAIRAHQPGIGRKEQAEAEEDFLGYLSLAASSIRPRRPRLIITRGLSASGKSTVTRSLLERLGAIRIRSDVERKRLFGLGPEERCTSAVDEGIYSPAATEKTYGRLGELAAEILDAGYPVIVDAVFMHGRERRQFKELADARRVPFVILECVADRETLRRRIVQRRNDVSDADLQILERQCAQWLPLSGKEGSAAVTVDTALPVDFDALAGRVREIPSSESLTALK